MGDSGDKGLRSRPNKQNATGGKDRRTSNWQQARDKTMQGAKKAAEGVGRWFGVAGDQQAVQAMHMEYMRQKTLGRPRKQPMPSVNQLQQAANILEEFSTSESSDDEIMRVKRMTRDVDKALKHYQDLWRSEKAAMEKPSWFGGVSKAKPSHRPSTTMTAPKRKHTYRRDETMVAMQLQALPTFTPWFVYIISLIQVLIFVGMMAYVYTKKEIAPYGLSTTITVCNSTGSDVCPTGFDGLTPVNGTTFYQEHNYLYGPVTTFLISVGAKFTLCMREDAISNQYLANQRATECGPPPNTCESSAASSAYSCCLIASSGRHGMASNATCTAVGGSWVYGPASYCNQLADFIVLRPCCGARLNVNCQLVTRDVCTYMGGQWQEDKQLCSDTLCLAPICKLLKGGYAITANPATPNQPSNPNQWFRFITPLFLHGGIIQVVIFVAFQLYLGRTVERQAGFFRTFCIYFISGVGGYITGGIFASSSASVGCDPAVFGFLAVHVVELFQNWQIVIHPFRELFKLIFIVLIALMIGTLPFIDNWSHIGGFIFGTFAGIVFLPYINFGQWDLRRKRIMLAIALPGLVVLFVLALVYFYKVQSTAFCSWCKWVDCVPYTSSINCGVDS